MPGGLHPRGNLVLQPERWTSNADEIKERDARHEANKSGPNFQREFHHFYVEHEWYAITHERDEDDEFPVPVDNAEANDW